METTKQWTTSRKDMDSFTENEYGQVAHVVYLYSPDDEPRIAVFGSNPRQRVELIVRAVNTFEQAKDALRELIGQIEQARDGFGIYRDSPSMNHALHTAKSALKAMEGDA